MVSGALLVLCGLLLFAISNLRPWGAGDSLHDRIHITFNYNQTLDSKLILENVRKYGERLYLADSEKCFIRRDENREHLYLVQCPENGEGTVTQIDCEKDNDMDHPVFLRVNSFKRGSANIWIYCTPKYQFPGVLSKIVNALK